MYIGQSPKVKGDRRKSIHLSMQFLKKERGVSRSFGSQRGFFLLVLVALVVTVLLTGYQPAFGQQKPDLPVYVVKPGDYLIKIGVNFGSPNFWDDIYEANKDQIDDPDLIYPDQRFIIPRSVTESPKFTGVEAEGGARDSVQAKADLEKFRKAFAKLVDNQKKQKPRGNGLEFGGLVIDETRSKLGKDFFTIFYRYWESPSHAPNFMLAITEKPLPSLGTLVTVKLDNQPVYQSRLQPRYEAIEEQAKTAVAISYRRLQQKLQTANQLIQY